jgi:DNA-directed RNA polymerase subunit RPC12/RpoP
MYPQDRQPQEVLIPATRDADGNITILPEKLQVTPVDECLFELITRGDRFVEMTCVECGFHAALFVCAGRFISLCPFCAVARIREYRQISVDPVELAWITTLDAEANKEAAFQHWKSEQILTVNWRDVYRCARCGIPIRAEDARYHHAPGERISPPYCGPCADHLREAEGPHE